MFFRVIVNIFLLLTVCFSTQLVAQEVSNDRQGELLHLLKHDCGSCHGMTLKGGLGPDLTAERLNKFPRDYLLNTIIKGRPGTPMPPWGPLLTEQEINWLLDQLLKGLE